VARAIYHCPLPVVSAIGHEVDFTIADFVADMRAPTPSAAVELVLPDRAELRRRVDRVATSLWRSWRRHLTGERRHLTAVTRRLPDLTRLLVDLRLRLDERAETLARRFRRHQEARRQDLQVARSRLLLLSPRRTLSTWWQRLEQVTPRLALSWRQAQEVRRRHVDYCDSHLKKLDPMAILQRGYAVATRVPEGTIIRDAALVPRGAGIKVKVAKGTMACEVIAKTK
jgi:exodeoxyribonuclease VII large subunit